MPMNSGTRPPPHRGLFAVRLSLLLVSVASAVPAAAQVFPAYLNYQGKLADTSGNPLTGTYSFQFNIWSSLTGGSQLFTEQWTGAGNAVSVVNGIYTIQIGAQ